MYAPSVSLESLDIVPCDGGGWVDYEMVESQLVPERERNGCLL